MPNRILCDGKVGYVYLAELDGDIKIGISNDPATRVARLCASKFNPRFLLQVKSENPLRDERLLHWIFRESSIGLHGLRGEWFSIDASDAIQAALNLPVLREEWIVPDDFTLRKYLRGRK